MSSSSSSSSSSFEDWRDAVNYRFSGYQLPKIDLDGQGDTYVVLDPHPYLKNQPLEWQKPAFRGSMPIQAEIIGGELRTDIPGSAYTPGNNVMGVTVKSTSTTRAKGETKNFSMLPLK